MNLSLPLLQARVFFVDDVDTTFPANNLAVAGPAFDRSTYFHKISSQKSYRRRPALASPFLSKISELSQRLPPRSEPVESGLSMGGIYPRAG